MPSLRHIMFLALFAVHLSAGAQFIFSSIPAEMKLIPRDTDNIGRFELTGKCFDPAKRFARVLLYDTDNKKYLFDQTLKLDQDSKFSLQLGIPAVFAEHKLIIYSMDALGNQTLEKEVKGLVAGDYFIIEGQSNAAGSNGYDVRGFRYDSAYANKYCRSLGTLFERAEYINLNLEADCRYYKPSALYFDNGCVAAWPYRLMFELCKKTGIPLCFMNSARGGSGITYHQASTTPSDPAKLQVRYDTALGMTMKPYDRTYYKMMVNNVLHGLKGIIWYQGETDGNLTYEDARIYTERFAKLRASWKADYPKLQKIFAFQINTGCAGDYHALIRDQQRQWPDVFNDVVVLPSVGSSPEERNEDGCHYSLQGCEKLGELMSPVVLKHVYGFDYADEQIMGPSVKKASYVSASRICLEFDQDIAMQLSTEYPNNRAAYLKDYFFKENYVRINVKDISIEGNKFFIDLEDTVEKINHITYLPNIYSEVGMTYMGPWIANKNNTRLGALSFYMLPVKRLNPPKVPDSTSRGQSYIRVWPSPADERVQIDISELEVTEMRLVDISGKILFEQELNASQTKTEINTSVLQNGLYTLMFIQPKGIRAVKLLVKHE